MRLSRRLDGNLKDSCRVSRIVDVGGRRALCGARVVGIRVASLEALEALAVLPRHHIEQHVEEQDDGYGSHNDFCSGATAVLEDVVADDARSSVQSYRTVDR